jgi:hypothetical protein
MRDQYSLRMWLAQLQQKHCPGVTARKMDELLYRARYPATQGTWGRIMTGRQVITKHIVDACAVIFEVPRDKIITDPVYERLDLCRNRNCDHGQMAR